MEVSRAHAEPLCIWPVPKANDYGATGAKNPSFRICLDQIVAIFRNRWPLRRHLNALHLYPRCCTLNALHKRRIMVSFDKLFDLMNSAIFLVLSL